MIPGFALLSVWLLEVSGSANARHAHLAVRLVREQVDVLLFAEVDQLVQLLLGDCAASRVVRVAD